MDDIPYERDILGKYIKINDLYIEQTPYTDCADDKKKLMKKPNKWDVRACAFKVQRSLNVLE